MPSRSGSARSSQLFVVLGFAVHLGLGLALTILLGRHLSAQDFGFFALVTALFAFARDAMDLGTTAVAARDIPRQPELERPLLEGLMAWRRLVGIGLAIAALALAARQSDAARQLTLIAVAAGLVGLAPSAFAAVFQARQALGIPTLINVSFQIAMLAACVALALHRVEGPVFAGLVVLREFLASLLAAFYGCWLVGYRPRPGMLGRGLRPFVGAAGVWALATACRHLYGQSDIFAVYLLRGEAELGALAAAYRPIAPAFLIPWLVSAPLVPVLTLAMRGAPGRFAAIVDRSLGIATAIGALGTASALVLAPELILVLYGGRYTDPALDAVTALRWLGLAVLPVCRMAVYAMALLSAGRERAAFRIIAVGLVAKIVLNLVLVPRFGFIAAVATTAMSEFALAVTLAWAYHGRRPSLRFGASDVAALAPAAAVLGLAPLVPGEPVLRLVAVLAVGAAGLFLLFRSRIGRDYFRAIGA